MNLLRKLPIWMVAAIGLMGCNQSGQKSDAMQDTLVIDHKLGKTTIGDKPSRIVVFDIGALETFNELGVKPIGIPKRYMPAYLSSLKDDETIGDVGSVIEPNLEAINALSPDLILISTRQERFYDELSKIGPTIYVGVDTKDYINSFKHNTLLIGSIVGKEKETEDKLNAVLDKIGEVRKIAEGKPGKALFLLYNNGRFNAYGKGSRFGFIHDVIGLQPALEHVEESVHGQLVSNELIAETNPDYLFIVDRNEAVAGTAAGKDNIENKLIQQTAAYKNHHIYYLDPEVWFISGGGLTSTEKMLEDMEKILKP
ncbi:siderophore ABC transporter substrate-binding protein [Olivibacter sitiensis]|uniref:siderophore ABC transporter substrate-binding protein n=1 Tax=Olivibacter sitiensis TaxID=376470 RepID=UPI0004054DA9|nr:ABC transporter substrate-binding protein [Olivibacter sitiensis]